MNTKNILRSLLNRWEVWFLVVFALFYYASYYRCGLNLGGEGGTAGVIALRLLEGQRPIADTFLGYNVLWFYPVAWLFQIFGIHYLVLKIYFFSICTFTALLAMFLIRRTIGGYFIVAVATGILLVLIPGMQFRNYMAFLAVLNMFTLSQVFIFSHNTVWQRRIWRVVAGVALGVTYLIRIDLGVFVSILVCILFSVFPWVTERGFREGMISGFKSLLTIGILVFVLHLPIVWDAQQRGFHDHFIGQYTWCVDEIKNRTVMLFEKKLNPAVALQSNSVEDLSLEAKFVVEKEKESLLAPAPTSPLFASSTVQEEVKKPILNAPVIEVNQSILSRPSLLDLLNSKPGPRIFAWAVYLPIPIILLIVIGMAIIWLIAVFKHNFEECRRALGVLLALGCALILFPQYFFFRPDTPHLSEFMVPFIVAMVLACSYAIQIAKTKRGVLIWAYTSILLFLCMLNVVAHVSNGLRRESSGSIAARKHCNREFNAQNGVRVFVQEKDLPILQGIYSTVMEYSKPTDWVVCYPYFPTINFMTNRRSYEFNLYVDNATRPQNFDEVTIKKLLCFQPAVVVVGHNALNKNESSRFKNWAASTYTFIKDHYYLVATYGIYEIFVRKKEMVSDEVNVSSKLID